MSQPKSAAIIAGAGLGKRLGANLPKALIQIEGISLVERAFSALSKVVDEIVITAPEGFAEEFRKIVGESAKVITGGILRSDSVKLALDSLSPSVEYVLVHDAARGLATSDLAGRILSELQGGEVAVIPALSVVDTIKEVDEKGYVRNTPNRASLRAIQTPQGFASAVLKRAHEASEDATDDAALVEAIGVKVKTIPGEARAMKVTNAEDISLAIALINPESKELRVGFGTSDPKYKGASGTQLLEETLRRIQGVGFEIKNVSVQIVCNRPKIGSRRIEIIQALSSALGGASVSVSATSTDGLGFSGEGKGIAAVATALVTKKK